MLVNSAWVQDSSIKPFTIDTFKTYFDRKHIRSKDYLHAIFEAFRILDRNSEVYTNELLASVLKDKVQ